MIVKRLAGVAAVISLTTTALAAPSPEERVAIVGATVLPMTATDRLPNQTILIEGDRITAVGPSATLRVPAGYRTIEGQGRFVMPGLVDMHMHLSPEPGQPGDSTQRALAMTLANGITTARVMLGQPVHPQVRAAIESGTLAGPRLYIAAQSRNDGNTPDEESARAAVRKAKTDRFDLMKVHGFQNVAVWQALHDEARKLRMPVAGHVTNTVGLDRATAAGQQVEHLDSVPAELLPPEASLDFGQVLTADQLDHLQGATADQYRALAEKVAANNGVHAPTLAAFEQITDLSVPFEEQMKAEDSAYVAGWIHDQWRSRRKGLEDAGFTLNDSRRMADVRRKIVAAFNQAGVRMIAGSDTPHPFHVWGFGLLREVEALSAAGLGPMRALRAATVSSRDYLRSLPDHGSALGWKADFGTVEPGARADLLLLDRDPSADLKALRSVRTLIAGGRVYDSATLKQMLAQASADAKLQPAPPQ